MTTIRRMRGREAFTTIELLTVIAIIAVLIALTTAGVQKVRIAAKRAEVGNEVGQLSTAIGVFQRAHNVSHIPSLIVLREKLDYNMSNPIERESFNYLVQVWPHIATLPAVFNNGNTTLGNGIDWNGDGVIAPLNTPWTLEGDQCLVFFLGGIPSNGGMSGFSNNPRDPSNTSNRTSTYTFKASNLKLRSTSPPGSPFNGFQPYDPAVVNNGNTTGGTNGFPSYTDSFGARPYLYFSAFNRKNGYLPFFGTYHDTQSITGATFLPYRDTQASPTVFTYYQPSGFQIISAGYDKVFGNGGERYQPAPGWVADLDNITNFSNGQLSGL